jgi:hypothetical protein
VFQLADLTGDAVAVDELDDVGLLSESRTRNDEQQQRGEGQPPSCRPGTVSAR